MPMPPRDPALSRGSRTRTRTGTAASTRAGRASSGTGTRSVGRGPGAGPPPGLTLLVGSESFLVTRAISRIIAAARASEPQVEQREVDALAPSAVGELQSALSPSLFGESAVVVVRGIADAPDAVLSTLLAGTGSLADGLWVVVEHSAGRSKAAGASLSALRALDPPRGVREVACGEVKRGRETRDLLVGEARAAGRRLTTDAVDALVLALGSEVSLLVGALEQLMSDSEEDPIDAAVVTGVFSGVGEVSGFQLADSVWDGQGLVGLQRLRWGLASQDISVAGAVGSLAAGLRGMTRVGEAPGGLPEAEVAKRAGVPPFKVRTLREAYRGWTARQLADAVVQLADVDAAVKGGLRPGEALDPAQKVHALEDFIVRTTCLSDERHGPRRGGLTR
jgi:DNA polymerase III subunit delta